MLVRSFVIGGDLQDHRIMSASLEVLAPHGDDYDAPSSTVAQDAVICIDTAIQCSSVNGDYDLASVWYALEPLMTALTLREYNVLQLGSGHEEQEWLDRAADEPEMARALRYCLNAVQALGGQDSIAPDLLDRLRGEAGVLRPAIV
jgi:hypothetical protein